MKSPGFIRRGKCLHRNTPYRAAPRKTHTVAAVPVVQVTRTINCWPIFGVTRPGMNTSNWSKIRPTAHREGLPSLPRCHERQYRDELAFGSRGIWFSRCMLLANPGKYSSRFEQIRTADNYPLIIFFCPYSLAFPHPTL